MTTLKSYTDEQVTALIEKWVPPGATVTSVGNDDRWEISFDGVQNAQVYCTGRCSRPSTNDWWILSGAFLPYTKQGTYYHTGGFGRKYIKRRELRVLLKDGAQYIRKLSPVEQLEGQRDERLRQINEPIHGRVENTDDVMHMNNRTLLSVLAMQGIVTEDPDVNALMHNAVCMEYSNMADALYKEFLTTSYDMAIKLAKEGV